MMRLFWIFMPLSFCSKVTWKVHQLPRDLYKVKVCTYTTILHKLSRAFRTDMHNNIRKTKLCKNTHTHTNTHARTSDISISTKMVMYYHYKIDTTIYWFDFECMRKNDRNVYRKLIWSTIYHWSQNNEKKQTFLSIFFSCEKQK
jgi:hypothetical protein